MNGCDIYRYLICHDCHDISKIIMEHFADSWVSPPCFSQNLSQQTRRTQAHALQYFLERHSVECHDTEAPSSSLCGADYMAYCIWKPNGLPRAQKSTKCCVFHICVDFLEGQFPLSINVNNQPTILMANSIIHLVPRGNLTWLWKLTISKCVMASKAGAWHGSPKTWRHRCWMKRF